MISRTQISGSRIREKKSRACFLLLFLLLFLFAPQTKAIPSSATPDTTKRKYSLDDPRNPDCPCHKYQNQAEKEYKNLSRKNGKPDQSNDIREKEFKNKIHSSSSFFDLKNSGVKIKSGKVSKLFYRINIKLKAKFSVWKKFHPNYAICFHWD